LSRLFEKEDAKVVISEEHFKHIIGSTLDYTSTMAWEGFVVKDNPQAVGACSCKESFTPADYPEF
jgi:Fe-S cluster assembly iron-binding protein IscA